MAPSARRHGIRATDEFGYHAAENKVHVHDLHATILHLLRDGSSTVDLPPQRPRLPPDRRPRPPRPRDPCLARQCHFPGILTRPVSEAFAVRNFLACASGEERNAAFAERDAIQLGSPHRFMKGPDSLGPPIRSSIASSLRRRQ